MKMVNMFEIFEPSRLYMYYNMRLLKQTIDEDSGGSMRDMLKAINTFGICPETLWPYDVDKLTCKPSSDAYSIGKRYCDISYYRVPQRLTQLKQCLIDGYLFMFGMSVYSNFETGFTEKTGIMCLPTEKDAYKGGHAVCAIGFNDKQRVFIARNSWGPEWGDNGYFYIPYEFMLNTEWVYDIWTFIINTNNVNRRSCIIN
jgi:C1A family cysteine protease